MMQLMFGLAALVALVLIAVGAWALLARRGPPLKPALMIAAGVVTLANIWLLTAPL